MLSRIDFDRLGRDDADNIMGTATAGILHTEVRTQFWAFIVLSDCCTKECFAAFMQPGSMTT